MSVNRFNGAMNKLAIALVLFGAVGAQAARKNKLCQEDPYVSSYGNTLAESECGWS